MRKYKLLWMLAIAIAFVADSSGQKLTPGTPTLKEAFKNDFLIGTALNANQIDEEDAGAAVLVPQQFNAITPENIMKCEVIHPGWDEYNFAPADKYVDYGRKHHMFVIGHNLIWHSQLSPFVHRIESSDSLMLFMSNHIKTVAGRYAGKVDGWDVVNEALEEDGSMRKSIFLEKLGDNFVTKAFELAQKAATNTELYYNDYNIEQPKKRAGAIALIKKIQAAGVRIDGVGIQGHWKAYDVPLRDIEESILEFSALGIKVMFTELDLGVLQNPWDIQGADVNQKAAATPAMNPYANGLPDSMEVKLTNSYERLFKLFLKHKDKISRVTFWGVNDAQSWLNGWPIEGRTNYPLLFDRNFNPKPAYYSVIRLKK
ncbi:MAG: endo-1,4-beta-xylanase [Ferruginibacter sp.]